MDYDILKVVVVTENGLRRTILNKKDIKMSDNDYQMILPDKHYSAGWAHRVWDINWNELPELESK